MAEEEEKGGGGESPGWRGEVGEQGGMETREAPWSRKWRLVLEECCRGGWVVAVVVVFVVERRGGRVGGACCLRGGPGWDFSGVEGWDAVVA